MKARVRGLREDIGVALVALLALLAWELSGLDLTVSARFGDASGFGWRDAWLMESVLHKGGRAMAWAVLGLMVLDVARPLVAGPSRAERMRCLGVTLACALLVPALKRASSTSCPWDLQRFGGVATYVSHWQPGRPDGGPGHCFPSGHAVAAFAFMSGYFLWRRQRPAAARRWLLGVCVAGLVFGAVQVARGAHFPSHVFWAAWLCWLVCLLFAAATERRERGPSVEAPAPAALRSSSLPSRSVPTRDLASAALSRKGSGKEMQ
jgi:membrane-associated PAP2 superfamily phosphatase